MNRHYVSMNFSQRTKHLSFLHFEAQIFLLIYKHGRGNASKEGSCSV